MRLTLRTLLAYLDDVLDPPEAAELGRKIEDSEFAQGLIHRIRSTSRRLRLGAPGLEGRGVGMDPNTVAEYLDSVLPPDRVPDLERICLESDVHLGEVAACHQVLVLLGAETIDVDPGLRSRMIQLASPESVVSRRDALTAEEPLAGEVPADGGVATSLPEPGAPPEATAPPVQLAATGRQAEVPDYLRAGRRSRLAPMALTLLFAFILTAVALRAIAPFDRHHPVLRVFTGAGREPPAQVATGASEEGGSMPTEPSATEPPGDQAEGPATGEATGAGPVSEPASPAASPVAPSGVASPPGVPDSASPSAEPALPLSPGAPVPALPETPPGTVPPNEPVFPETEPVMPEGPPAPADPEETPPATPESVEAVAVEAGYVKAKDHHFLVRWDPKTQDWFRLPERTKLFSGELLRVLPTYQPEVVLTSGVQVVFAGPSGVRLVAPNAQGEPVLQIEFVRAFIATAGVAGARVHLLTGNRQSSVTFVDAASELAIEVRPFLPPGANPERDARLLVVRVIPTIGRIEWQDASTAAPTPLAEGQARILIDEAGQTIEAGDIPGWMKRQGTREIEAKASLDLQPYVTPERPLSLSLKERTEDRRTEIRWLAASSLAYLDAYDSLIRELADDRQRSHWSVEFDALRAAVARSPESAARVRTAIERLAGDKAADTYRLLWGFSPEQLQEGADARLVAWLGDLDPQKDPPLSLRVLAFENLRRITGMTQSYLPYVTEDRRRASKRGWEERQKAGGVVYAKAVTPISEEW